MLPRSFVGRAFARNDLYRTRSVGSRAIAEMKQSHFSGRASIVQERAVFSGQFTWKDIRHERS